MKKLDFITFSSWILILGSYILAGGLGSVIALSIFGNKILWPEIILATIGTILYTYKGISYLADDIFWQSSISALDGSVSLWLHDRGNSLNYFNISKKKFAAILYLFDKEAYEVTSEDLEKIECIKQLFNKL